MSRAKKGSLTTVLICLTLAGASPPALAQQGAPSSGEWPTYGGDLGSTKYSPLDQITPENFSDLQVAWEWASIDGLLSVTLPDGSEWTAPSDEVFDYLTGIEPDRWAQGNIPNTGNLKATPLMVDGTLYFNTPLSIGVAVDAATGDTKWVYDPKSYQAGTTSMTTTWNERGVAYWTDGTEARVFWGTGDAYLICVDAATGRPCADFGEGGRVDLIADIPRVERGQRDWQNKLIYSVQSAPIVVGNTVVTPQSISSLNIVKEMPPGWTRGFDVHTGKTLWTFHTIPQPGEFGHDTWESDAWSYNGKVGVWTEMSADPELGLLYVPLNTAAPDFYGGYRPGDNLFAESLVALNIETGERVWHYQLVHHGLWDYDPPAAPNLMDVVVDGRSVPAVVQITKQGFVYAFNRATGEPLWPIEERPVPTDTDLEGEVPSPTQPFPTRPAPFEYQGTSVDDLVDFTPELRQMAVDAVEGYRMGPLFTPPTLQGTLTRPGSMGGANWSGAAVDPETGIIYIPSRNGYTTIRYREPEAGEPATLRYIQVYGATARMPQGLPLWKPPYSRLTAIDMNSGEHVWMTPTGNGDRIRNNEMLAGLDLPPLGGDAGSAGPLLTKTLLIYPLTAGGTDNGPRLVAYDKATGTEIASVDLPGTALGAPMTYMLEGRQYVAVAVASQPVPEIVAFRLPG